MKGPLPITSESGDKGTHPETGEFQAKKPCILNRSCIFFNLLPQALTLFRFFFFFFFLFSFLGPHPWHMEVPKRLMGATVALESGLCLRPTPQLIATLDP